MAQDDEEPVSAILGRSFGIHPAARMFPEMSRAALITLGKDIKANGLREKITLLRLRDGGKLMLLDGRSRRDAMMTTGLPTHGKDGNLRPELFEVIDETDGFDPVAFVVSKNLHRRHLNSKQKREVIAAMLMANPKRSDSATAKLAGSSDKTVTAVRTELEAKSEIPNKPERTEASGRWARGRKPRPARTEQSVRVRAGETVITGRAKSASAIPASQKRNQAVAEFGKLLHSEPFDTLDDLNRMLAGEAGNITAIPQEKRIALARGYLAALGVVAGDLGSAQELGAMSMLGAA